MQFCQANQEALQRQVKSNVKDSVETKVNFNVVQGLEAGELEVDVPELQALMKARDQPQEALQQQPKAPCSCCDQPCGCEPGQIRRHCPRCRHKECEAEKKCGGPEALTRLQQEPLKRPLRPAEIPLKLPVRLTCGMNGPEMQAAKIIRTPNIQEPLIRDQNGQCDRCGKCGANPSCDCHNQTAGKPAYYVPQASPPIPVHTTAPTNDDLQAPPKPIPDDSARSAPKQKKDGLPNVISRFVTTNIFTAQRPAQTASVPDRVPRP